VFNFFGRLKPNLLGKNAAPQPGAREEDAAAVGGALADPLTEVGTQVAPPGGPGAPGGPGGAPKLGWGGIFGAMKLGKPKFGLKGPSASGWKTSEGRGGEISAGSAEASVDALGGTATASAQGPSAKGAEYHGDRKVGMEADVSSGKSRGTYRRGDHEGYIEGEGAAAGGHAVFDKDSGMSYGGRAQKGSVTTGGKTKVGGDDQEFSFTKTKGFSFGQGLHWGDADGDGKREIGMSMGGLSFKSETLGRGFNKLSGAAGKAAGFADKNIPGFKGARGVAGKVGGKLLDGAMGGAGAVTKGIGDAAETVSKPLIMIAPGLYQNASGQLVNAGGKVLGAAGTAGKAFGQGIQKGGKAVGNGAKKAGKAVGKGAKKAGKAVKKGGKAVKKAMKKW
jgi:hypothetical protein